MNNQKNTQGYGLTSYKASSGIEAFSITLSKKCERLATAVYLVTNFLSDTEPLKSRLRTLSLDFVRDASFVRYGGQTTEANVLDALRTNIGETLSLLELAFIAGLVSEMNFTILKREYASLRDSIDIKKASRESRTDTILGDNFFSHPRADLTGTPEGRSSALHPAPMSDRTPKGQTQTHPASRTQRPDLSASALSQRSGLSVPASSPRSDLTSTPEGRSSVSAPSPLPTNDYQLSTGATRDSRRARILKLVKDNREVAIRDIVAHFPDISEKTIQRELVSLSDSGVLKKSGERRWSRYSLA